MNSEKQPVTGMRRSAKREDLPGFHFVPSGLGNFVPSADFCSMQNPHFRHPWRSRPGGRKNIQSQRGISLVIVIFLLAVVSVLTLSMMNLSGTQHISSLYTFRGAQAYYAARSGIEYAVAQLVNGAACADQTFSGFAVAITCQLVGTYNEGNAAAPYSVYRVTATASDGTFQVPDVANRRLTVTVKVP